MSNSKVLRHDLDHLKRTNIDIPEDIEIFQQGEGILYAATASKSSGWVRTVRGINLPNGLLLITTTAVADETSRKEFGAGTISTSTQFLPCMRIVPTYDPVTGELLSSVIQGLTPCDCCGDDIPVPNSFQCVTPQITGSPTAFPNANFSLTITNLSGQGACFIIGIKILSGPANNPYIPSHVPNLFITDGITVDLGVTTLLVPIPPIVDGYTLVPGTKVALEASCCGNDCSVYTGLIGTYYTRACDTTSFHNITIL